MISRQSALSDKFQKPAENWENNFLPLKFHLMHRSQSKVRANDHTQFKGGQFLNQYCTRKHVSSLNLKQRHVSTTRKVTGNSE